MSNHNTKSNSERISMNLALWEICQRIPLKTPNSEIRGFEHLCSFPIQDGFDVQSYELLHYYRSRGRLDFPDKIKIHHEKVDSDWLSEVRQIAETQRFYFDCLYLSRIWSQADKEFVIEKANNGQKWLVKSFPNLRTNYYPTVIRIQFVNGIHGLFCIGIGDILPIFLESGNSSSAGTIKLEGFSSQTKVGIDLDVKGDLGVRSGCSPTNFQIEA